jgi:hypothetical protein
MLGPPVSILSSVHVNVPAWFHYDRRGVGAVLAVLSVPLAAQVVLDALASCQLGLGLGRERSRGTRDRGRHRRGRRARGRRALWLGVGVGVGVDVGVVVVVVVWGSSVFFSSVFGASLDTGGVISLTTGGSATGGGGGGGVCDACALAGLSACPATIVASETASGRQPMIATLETMLLRRNVFLLLSG